MTSFETTYNYYAKYFNSEDLTKSAYDVLDHFFSKFSYLINKLPVVDNIKNDLEEAKHDIDFSIGLAYDLEFMVLNIDIREVDPKSFRNDYLCNIQTNVFQINAMVVDYIIKYEIYQIFRFNGLTDIEAENEENRMKEKYKTRCDQVQRKSKHFIDIYMNEHRKEMERIRQIKSNVNILYDKNLICKDVSSLICQYLI